MLDKENESLLLIGAEIDSRGLTDDEAVALALFVVVIDLRDDAVLLADREGDGEDEGLVDWVGVGKELRVADDDADCERLSTVDNVGSADFEGDGLKRGDRDGEILADVLRDVSGENVVVAESIKLRLTPFESELLADEVGLAVKVRNVVPVDDGIIERVTVDV